MTGPNYYSEYLDSKRRTAERLAHHLMYRNELKQDVFRDEVFFDIDVLHNDLLKWAQQKAAERPLNHD